MRYIYVESGSKRTNILGQELLGSLNDLDLTLIRWENEWQRWVCYEEGENTPANASTPPADPASS